MRRGFGVLLLRSDPCVADCAACTAARVACVSVRIAGEEHRDPLDSIAALAVEHSTAMVGASPLQRVVTLVRVVEDAQAATLHICKFSAYSALMCSSLERALAREEAQPSWSVGAKRINDL
jgi:hypothetical protein